MVLNRRVFWFLLPTALLTLSLACDSRSDVAETPTPIATTNAELDKVKVELATAIADQAKLKGDLASNITDQARLKGDLASNIADQAKTKGELATSITDQARLKGDLASNIADQAKTKGDLATVTTDLAKVKGDISSASDDQAKTKRDLATATTDLAKVKADLAATAADLAKAKADIASNAAALQGEIKRATDAEAKLQASYPLEVINIRTNVNPYRFAPDTLNLQLGKTYLLVFAKSNEFHTFTVPELNVDILINPGKDVQQFITPSKAGTFKLICTPYEGLGMVGQVIVQ